MSSLPSGDMRVLRYIRKHGPVSFRRCIKRFGADSQVRLERLFRKQLIENEHTAETAFSPSRGLITTKAGRITLKDARAHKWEALRNSVLIPIVVAFVTAVLTVDLWPPLKRWLLETIRQWI